MKNRFVGGADERILGLDKIIECYDDRLQHTGIPRFPRGLLGDRVEDRRWSKPAGKNPV